MPYANQIIVTAAGGGKTSYIVEQALDAGGGAIALVTYTRNNVLEIKRKIYNSSAAIPEHIEVLSWYSFLLRELARPYRATIHKNRIEGLHWIEGRSVPYIPSSKIGPHYFYNEKHIYSDKISKFVIECNYRSGGAVMRRLRARFSRLIIDEIQDMAGYDLDLLELIMREGCPILLVGDHRQATYATNHASRNSAFAGLRIIKKFNEWKDDGLTELAYQNQTYRCNQIIADLSDTFFPSEPHTVSLNEKKTGHDGVFLVASSDVESYIAEFRPQVLRFSAATRCDEYLPLNFGEAKGLTFERVLIFPHGKAKSWLATGQLTHIEKTLAKLYVAVTRARYSVAFVYDSRECDVPAERWVPARELRSGPL